MSNHAVGLHSSVPEKPRSLCDTMPRNYDCFLFKARRGLLLWLRADDIQGKYCFPKKEKTGLSPTCAWRILIIFGPFSLAQYERSLGFNGAFLSVCDNVGGQRRNQPHTVKNCSSRKMPWRIITENAERWITVPPGQNVRWNLLLKLKKNTFKMRP